MKICIDCGDVFEAAEPWKVRCLPCWKASKSESSDHHDGIEIGKRAGLQRKIAKLHSEIEQQLEFIQVLEARNDLLRRENHELKQAANTMSASLAPLIVEERKLQEQLAEMHSQLPRLIQLCHPDKHCGSQASQNATQWLLQIRKLRVAA